MNELENINKEIKQAADSRLINTNHVENVTVNKSVRKATAIILLALIAALICAVDIIGYNNVKHKANEMFADIGHIIENFDVMLFNCALEQYTGIFSKVPVEKVLTKIVKVNKNGEKEIIVVFNGKEYTDEDDILDVQSNLWGERYNISYNYDKEGYINKAIIQQKFSEQEKIKINGYIASYTGHMHGQTCAFVLTQAISNNTNVDKKIIVSYDGVITQDESEINEIIEQIATKGVFTLTQEYDEEGYIKKIIITK